MRIAIRIVQVIVAILFIVSGLVKANDPLGLGYKMQEFLELWSSSLAGGHFFARHLLISLFDFLHEHSLFLAVSMITLEIFAGMALLLGWMQRFILSLLLFLIVFFTFLTGYAYLSGKFTNCGCFGDCLPITPYASFVKDITLLLMIVFLLIGQENLFKLASIKVRRLALVLSLVLSLVLQWYVLEYLPLVDCLPFKKGKNIAREMLPPPGSLPDSTAIRYIYEKNGQRFEWSPQELPADFESYTYVDRIDKLIRKGNADPPIKGFSLTGITGTDSTRAFLEAPQYLAIFCLNTDNIGQWSDDLIKLQQTAGNIPICLITSASMDKTIASLQKKGLGTLQVFNCDFTILKTAARVNPTVYYLEKGTIAGKWSGRRFASASDFIRKNHH